MQHLRSTFQVSVSAVQCLQRSAFCLANAVTRWPSCLVLLHELQLWTAWQQSQPVLQQVSSLAAVSCVSLWLSLFCVTVTTHCSRGCVLFGLALTEAGASSDQLQVSLFAVVSPTSSCSLGQIFTWYTLVASSTPLGAFTGCPLLLSFTVLSLLLG